MVRRKTQRRPHAPSMLLEHLESRVLLSGAPVVSLVASKATATELNGATTGAGVFTLTRSGPRTAALTVAYSLDGASTAVDGVDFNSGVPLSGVAVFEMGSAKATIVINPVDTQLADGPKTVILDLLASGTLPANTVGRSHTAKVTIVDHAPTVTVAVTKNASEINGNTTGAGVFTFKRSGSTAGTLTANFTVAGNAAEGGDYATLTPHSVTFAAGKATATVVIHPVDDLLTEGKEKVTLTVAADGTPSSYHFKATAASMTIADDTRPIFWGTIVPLAGAAKNTPFAISYDDLVAATGVQDHAGSPVWFKITAVKSGTLTEDGAAVVAGKATVTSTDGLVWTPKNNATGPMAAFSVVASDGTHSTPTATLTVSVGSGAALSHPQLQVMPAALDQPQINAIAYVGNSTTPQFGTTTTIDPLTLDDTTVSTFNVSGYLDTGASGILISNPTNSVLNIPLASSGGAPVIYSDVGVAGSDDFQVSEPVRLSLASSYQRTDLDQFSDLAQTQPITTPYTPIPNDSLRVQVGPFVPTVDNPVTDDFSSIFSDLQALDVIGMPAMMGRVVVIDPTRVNNFGTVMDQLLTDPSNIDLSILDADMSVHSFIYAPGTPFHPATTATDPGIPTTDVHVKLSYGSFDRFTQVTPGGQPGPTLAHNPFIGEDPVSLMEGTPQPAVPGIKITRSIPAAGGGTETLSSEGNWLLDTGAAASIISKAQAAKLDVTYEDGTFGTDAPVLVDQDGNPLPDQFTLGIGGIGGQETLAGFYLDSLLVRTQEGNAANDADPAHLIYVHEPVLVGDITVKDPNTAETLTLDGVFGMNNLVASADFSLDSSGGIGNFDAASGYFNWITFDEPNGVLGLNFDPAALAAAANLAAPSPQLAAPMMSAARALQPTAAGVAVGSSLTATVSGDAAGGVDGVTVSLVSAQSIPTAGAPLARRSGPQAGSTASFGVFTQRHMSNVSDLDLSAGHLFSSL